MRPLLTLAAALLAIPLAAEPPAAVRLDAVAYADLASELRALKGKVVLVDVWGTFCAPCKEKFPSVAAMHEKYARRGLAVVSVSVDSSDDPEAREAARAFLARHRASFRNVILTDRSEVWQEKWKVNGPPLVFLFDRQGRLVAKWQDKVDMKAVETRLVALLDE